MPVGTRYTAKFNEESQKVEVLKVVDGPDNRPASTEVVDSFDSSDEANNKIRALVEEDREAAKTGEEKKKADKPKAEKADKDKSDERAKDRRNW